MWRASLMRIDRYLMGPIHLTGKVNWKRFHIGPMVQDSILVPHTKHLKQMTMFVRMTGYLKCSPVRQNQMDRGVRGA